MRMPNPISRSSKHQDSPLLPAGPKPLLRGWSHALAAVVAVVVTISLLARSAHDLSQFIAVLVFGLSMILLYLVSSIYHIGAWQGRHRQILRAFDHANIFVLIAGTYTPICVMVLSGAFRTTILTLIWLLAAAGVISSVLSLRLPRWLATGLYIGMGWMALVPLPQLLRTLPGEAIALLLAGGLLYTFGGMIYAAKRPNPSPRFFGFHEIFHLFVIAGSSMFVLAIWGWVLPFGQG